MIGACQAAVHLHHVAFGHCELGRDLLDVFRGEIAFLDRLQLTLELAQVEEQLLLCRGGSHLHQRPRMQDVFLDCRPDPPHSISGKAEAAIGLEAFHRLHQADIAFRDQFREGKAVAAIPHRDLGNETQMAGHQPMGCIDVIMLAPALGEHVLLVGIQHREAANLLEITAEIPFRAQRADAW